MGKAQYAPPGSAFSIGFVTPDILAFQPPAGQIIVRGLAATNPAGQLFALAMAILDVLTPTTVADATCSGGRCELGTQYVVRGGMGKPGDFEKGTVMTINGFGFSVQTRPNISVAELARGGYFKNGTVSFTTVAQLQAMPGVVVNRPTPGRGDYHGTVNVPNPPPPGFFKEVSEKFTTIRNPYQVQ